MERAERPVALGSGLGTCAYKNMCTLSPELLLDLQLSGEKLYSEV
jgi:hypothetical protein